MEVEKNLIKQCIAQEQYEQAETLLKSYCQQYPSDAESSYMLGLVLGQLGRLGEAEAIFRRVVALQPGVAVGYGSLGSVLRRLGEFPEAAEALQKACELLPGDEGYRLELIESLQQAGRHGDAFHECHKLLEDLPESGRGYVALANLCYQKEQYTSAIRNYLQALEYESDLTTAHMGLGRAYGTLGDRELARQHFEAVLKQKPTHVDAIAGLATIFERGGELDEAYKMVRHVVDAGRYQAAIAHVYTNICNRFDDCERAVEYAETTLATLNDNARSDRKVLHFSLGRRYDKMGEYDRAFAHFQQANRQFPVNYDPAAHTDYITSITQTFTPAYMMSAPRASNRSTRPVFIVGMPRSGTTLVEQVISSHPEAAAGGELEDISEMLWRISGLTEGSGYPKGVPDLTTPMLDKLAEEYLEHLREISADAVVVTDKMPHNFMALGLIAQLFPGARVIHCRREPLDTCLSIFFQSFLRQHDYASDLENIGTHYRQYLRLMRHWKNVLDIPMLEVEYVRMIEDQENVTRELLDFCGLEWNEACLAFHKSKRVAHTASYSQVRQPLYRQSLERWRHYERHLDGLKEALERDY